MKPEQYLREPRCGMCRGSFRIDKFRLRRENKKYACACPGYLFLHRRGSLYCEKGYIGSRTNIPFHLSGYDEETVNEIDALLKQREEEWRQQEEQKREARKHRLDHLRSSPAQQRSQR